MCDGVPSIAHWDVGPQAASIKTHRIRCSAQKVGLDKIPRKKRGSEATEPEAAVSRRYSLTQNWNPGAYNDHPIAVAYDTDRDLWLIYNTNLALIKGGCFQREGFEVRRKAMSRALKAILLKVSREQEHSSCHSMLGRASCSLSRWR